MVAFPNQQAFAQPYPRNRTNQGGNGRRVRGASGLPNTDAMGFNNWNPMGGSREPALSPNQGPTPPHQFPGGGSPGPIMNNGGALPGNGNAGWQPPGGGAGPGGGDGGTYWGADPNHLMQILQNMQGGRGGGVQGGPLGPPVGTMRNPLDHLKWWEQQGWRYNENTGRFHQMPGAVYGQGGFGGPGDGRPPGAGGGGGGGNQGIPGGGGPGPVVGGGNGGNGNGQGGGGGNGQGGGGGPVDDGGWSDIPGLPAGYKPTMPLDAQFSAQVKMLNDALSGARSNAQIGYDTGNAALNYQSDQDNRQLDASMAARGLFGSGLERRGERLIGNDIGLQRTSLLNQLTQGQAGAQSDYSKGLMEALLALAQRQGADPNMAMAGY